MFKFQQPSDLISRLYILEYMREIGAEKMYQKCNKYQQESFFYKFLDDAGVEAVDFNWEYCLFMATMFELEKLMENFEEELAAVEASRNEYLMKCKHQLIQEKIEEHLSGPVDINLMSVAQAEMRNSQGKIIT